MVIIIILFSITSFNGLALKPINEYVATPNNYALMFKEYDVLTSDSMKIKLWFYPAQEVMPDDSVSYYYHNNEKKRKYLPETEAKPTIIISNGDGGNMSYLISYAYKFCTNGFNVVTFDWRGYGQSSNYPIDTNYVIIDEFYTDFDAVIEFLSTNDEINISKIGVFGFSTGAFMSYAMAYKHEEIESVVTRGLFYDYESTVDRLKMLNPNDTYWYPKEIDEFSPKNTVDNFYKPIFLIVGENDKVTPKAESLKVLSNVRSNSREIWIVENAGHGGSEAPEHIQERMFFNKVIRFFNETLIPK